MAKNATNKVVCPKCGHEFDVNQSFIENAKKEAEKEFQKQIIELQKDKNELEKLMKSQQEDLVKQQEEIEERLKKDFEKQFKDEANKKIKEMQDFYNKQGKEIQEQLKLENEQKMQFLQQQLEEKSKEALEVSKLRADMLKIQREKDEMQAKIELEVQEQTDSLKEELDKKYKDAANQKIKEMQQYYGKQELEIKAKLEEEHNLKMEILQQQLEEKSKEALEVSKLRADMLKIQREKDEIKVKAEYEYQIQLNKSLEEQREKMQKQAAAEYQLKIMEMEKQLDDQKKLTEEMKRKQEQGSMQLQGETQELYIEKWLAEAFPLDRIEEVKKGANGADCFQIVNTTEKQDCGTIYYESKNTQRFGADWIEKFKKDIKDKGANIGVLVTSVYPKGMTRMGVKDGVYICSLEEFKGLTVILREELIKTSQIIASQANRHDKKELLYNYLTSQEFAMQITGIIESYRLMQKDLDSEKTLMLRHWKYREKQLQNVLESATSISSSIQSIANILTTAQETLLQLPGATEDEEDFDDDLIG